MSNFLFFSDIKILENYIESGEPLDIIDRTTDYTLFMFVCDKILNTQPYEPWANLAMKMLEFTPEQINLKYANRDGITALILVCGVDVDVSLKIISNGPVAINLNAVEKDNKMNALMYALTKDTEKVANKLLDFPQIVTSLQNINKNGYTPLMLTCEEELDEITLKMLDNFPSAYLNLFQKNNRGQTAFDIAIEHRNMCVGLIYQFMNEDQIMDNIVTDDYEMPWAHKEMPWAHKEMPVIPDFLEEVIDINGIGYDPYLLEERNIKEYLDEDKLDNIVIKYEGKNYLLSRSIIQQQMEDAIIFECLQGYVHGEGDNDYTNVVQNLPLYNIKAIGIDIPQDKTGIWPEFIYMNGIVEILNSPESFFSVLPLVDVMLVSVISLHEVKRIGTGQVAYGSLHCQTGQGGMAGVIIPAKAFITAGKKRRTKRKSTKQKKKTLKKKQHGKKEKPNKRKNKDKIT